MDNEGLLEWAEYDVKKAREVLKRAELHRDERRKAVEEDKDKEAYDIDTLIMNVCTYIKQETARIRKKNEFKMEYGVSKVEYDQTEQNIEAQKAFLRRWEVSGEELEY
jgi:site-specific DNA-adenine methylase